MQALIRPLQSEASNTLRKKHKRTSLSLLICGVNACGKSVSQRIGGVTDMQQSKENHKVYEHRFKKDWTTRKKNRSIDDVHCGNQDGCMHYA